MFRKRLISGLLLLGLLSGLAGCSWGPFSPIARRQRYADKGKRYYEQGKYTEAVIELSNANNIDPGFPEVHFLLSQCYAHTGSYLLAFVELKRTVDLQPGNVEAHVQMGELLLAN